MKHLYVIGMIGIMYLMTGCFSNKPTPSSTQNEIEKMCNEAKYTITLGQINDIGQNVLSKQDFRTILDKALRDSGCFVVESKLNNREKGYVLNIEYGLEVKESKKDTSAVSTQSSASLKSEVRFVMSRANYTITQNASSIMKMSGKKYLGIGEEPQITQEQKERLVQRALKTIFTNLLKI